MVKPAQLNSEILRTRDTQPRLFTRVIKIGTILYLHGFSSWKLHFTLIVALFSQGTRVSLIRPNVLVTFFESRITFWISGSWVGCKARFTFRPYTIHQLTQKHEVFRLSLQSSRIFPFSSRVYLNLNECSRPLSSTHTTCLATLFSQQWPSFRNRIHLRQHLLIIPCELLGDLIS